MPVIAALVALAPPERSGRPSDEPRGTASLASPASRETESPWQPAAGALALSGAAWRGRDTAMAARRNVVTGAREDHLTAGSFEGSGPWSHLVVSRSSGTGASGSLFLATARRAAAAGLAVARTGPSVPLATRFGPAEIAPVTLASGAGERACTALRLTRPESGFALEGWFCASHGQPAPEAGIACALEGLTLAAGASDTALKTLFAEAEKRRSQACDGPERTVVASGRTAKSPRR